ncbi:MAG: hypothetical protein U0359_22545 [Byssovorax sp.]
MQGVPEVKYTQVAAKALSLAELFEERFRAGLDGPVPFRIELAAPDGPSTGGGKLALQHIKLVPASGGGGTIVIGAANAQAQTAEIRTFEQIADLYAQRYRGAVIPVDIRKYRDLCQELAAFLRAMKLNVTMVDVESSIERVPQASQSNTVLLVAIVVGVAVTAFGILVVLAIVLKR